MELIPTALNQVIEVHIIPFKQKQFSLRRFVFCCLTIGLEG